MKKLISILFILSAILVYGQNIPTNGLVAYYPFNGNANDASGNNLHAQVLNAALSQDRFNSQNNSYFFDISTWNNWINIPYNPSFNSSQITVAVWVKRTSNGNTNNGMNIINRFQYG